MGHAALIDVRFWPEADIGQGRGLGEFIGGRAGMGCIRPEVVIQDRFAVWAVIACEWQAGARRDTLGEDPNKGAAVFLRVPNIVPSVKIEPAAAENFPRIARIGKS